MLVDRRQILHGRLGRVLSRSLFGVRLAARLLVVHSRLSTEGSHSDCKLAAVPRYAGGNGTYGYLSESCCDPQPSRYTGKDRLGDLPPGSQSVRRPESRSLQFRHTAA